MGATLALASFLLTAITRHTAAAGPAATVTAKPPMGRATWYGLRCDFGDPTLRVMADRMVANGMAAAGYDYLNVDDCWAASRDANGDLRPDPRRFPDGMAGVARYVHARGLKFGIYSSAGDTTCQQELQADGERIAMDTGNCWACATDWGQLGVVQTFDRLAAHAAAGGPGGWNDPDVLMIGHGVLTPDEERAQISIYVLAAAPLIAAADLRRALVTNGAAPGPSGRASLFLGNHDYPRMASHFGSEQPRWRARSARALATLLLTRRATPFVYQGDKLGMTNYPFATAAAFRDVSARVRWTELVETGRKPATVVLRELAKTSRDNARTPMQWTGGPNGGFTSGTPWIAVNPNASTVNAAAEWANDGSVLRHYQRLIALRRRRPALSARRRRPGAQDGALAIRHSGADRPRPGSSIEDIAEENSMTERPSARRPRGADVARFRRRFRIGRLAYLPRRRQHLARDARPCPVGRQNAGLSAQRAGADDHHEAIGRRRRHHPWRHAALLPRGAGRAVARGHAGGHAGHALHDRA